MKLFILTFITELFAIFGMQAESDFSPVSQSIQFNLQKSSARIYCDRGHTNLLLPEVFKKNEISESDEDEHRCQKAGPGSLILNSVSDIGYTQNQPCRSGRYLATNSPGVALFIRYHCWKYHI